VPHRDAPLPLAELARVANLGKRKLAVVGNLHQTGIEGAKQPERRAGHFLAVGHREFALLIRPPGNVSRRQHISVLADDHSTAPGRSNLHAHGTLLYLVRKLLHVLLHGPQVIHPLGGGAVEQLPQALRDRVGRRGQRGHIGRRGHVGKGQGRDQNRSLPSSQSPAKLFQGQLPHTANSVC
jgi:hypothetical protein